MQAIFIGIIVNISEAHQDFVDGENYVKDVDFSFSCSGTDQIAGTTRIGAEGTIQSEYSETGKTQEELLRQVIEGLEGYEPYTEEGINVKISIFDDQGEEVDYIPYSGTKEEIIENIKSDFGIQESSIENDGATEEIAFSASEAEEVVAQQKPSRMRAAWKKFENWLHRGPDRSNEGR